MLSIVAEAAVLKSCVIQPLHLHPLVLISVLSKWVMPKHVCDMMIMSFHFVVVVCLKKSFLVCLKMGMCSTDNSKLGQSTLWSIQQKEDLRKGELNKILLQYKEQYLV